MQKRALLINDISGVGKCSLTVALPIISAFGVEANVLPTAVLSTHTGGFDNYSFCDLTDNMLPMARHWHSLGLHFDVIYCGYLGSERQIEIVLEILRLLKSDDTVVLVDPVMGDFGRLYTHFASDFPKKLRPLCERADIIVPNITEACLLTDMPYSENHGRECAERLIAGLEKICCSDIVLTGVGENDRLGAACLSKSGGLSFCFAEKTPGVYHGSGDVFCSVMCGSLMRGDDLRAAVSAAVKFTAAAIKRTCAEGIDTRYGLIFEPELWRILGKTNK